MPKTTVNLKEMYFHGIPWNVGLCQQLCLCCALCHPKAGTISLTCYARE